MQTGGRYLQDKLADARALAREAGSHPGCLPQNLLGFAVSLVTLGERQPGRGGWSYYRHARGLGAALPRLFGQDAITIGNLSFCNGAPGPHLIAHEYRHYEQSVTERLRFLPGYLLAAARVRGDHDTNPYEQDASLYAAAHPWRDSGPPGGTPV